MNEVVKAVESVRCDVDVRSLPPVLKVAGIAAATPENPARDAIQRFMSTQDCLSGVVLSSVDGLVIASAVREPHSTSKLGAMASALLGLCDAAASESGIGESEQLVIEAKDGRLIAMTMRFRGRACVLMAIAGAAQSLGKVIWAARQCRASVEVIA